MLDATEGDSATDKKMTKEQLAGFSIDFLLAGYETTANTLSYTTYLLAMNPDVQEKLQAEIDQYFEEDPVSIHLNSNLITSTVASIIRIAIIVFNEHRRHLCMKQLRSSSTLIWLSTSP